MSKSSIVLRWDALDASEELGSWNERTITDRKLVQQRQVVVEVRPMGKTILACVRSGSGMIPETVALAVMGSCDCCSARAS